MNPSLALQTKFHEAVRDSHQTEVKNILQCEFDINVPVGKFKNTPLITAISNHNIEMVQLILSHKSCNVNAPDIDGLTPLHVAIFFAPTYPEQGFIIIDMLLKKPGINVNHPIRQNGCKLHTNQSGRTPLHFAAECKLNKVYAKLIELGANEYIQDDAGKTPKDLYDFYSDPEKIKAYLKKHYQELPNSLASTSSDYGPLVMSPLSSSNNSSEFNEKY